MARSNIVRTKPPARGSGIGRDGEGDSRRATGDAGVPAERLQPKRATGAAGVPAKR